MENEIKLLPCPFCGGEAVLNQVGRKAWHIKCTKCLMGLKQKTIHFSLEWLMDKMIESWNKRVFTPDCE